MFGFSKKLITFVVPCYNSQNYMERCINTLLKAKDDCEIIIVNDGSEDDTLKIAKGYKKRYPRVIKVIDKKNGGHGSAVNAGLKVANGKYFKVVDSDDWLDETCLIKLINRMKQVDGVDLFICNYVYDHLYDGYQKVMRFDSIFFENKVTKWEEIAAFRISQHLIMHSLIYRTKILKNIKLKLPENSFYVDNIVAFTPLEHVNTIYYMDLNLYHFFIGREDQSVNEQVMMQRIDEVINVTKIMIDSFEMKKVERKSLKLKKYMVKYLSMMVTICDVYLNMINDEESLEKKEELWSYIKIKDIKLYHELQRSLSGLSNIPGKFGNIISLIGYKIAKKLFKFN